MKPFADIWPFTDSIPGSFTELSASKLYQYACGAKGVIAEIGVDQGRSASVLFEAAAQTGASLILVDSWESVLIDNYYKVKRLREFYPSVVTGIHRMTSVDAAHAIDVELSLVHVDANHRDWYPANDCDAWLPKLKPNGIACFHDYHQSWPSVIAAVNSRTRDWEDLGVWDSLAIRRKP